MSNSIPVKITVFVRYIARIILLVIPFQYYPAIYAHEKTEINANPFMEYTSKGEKANTDNDLTLAIKHFIQAKSLADKSGNPAHICLGAYNLGVCYFNLCEYGEALRYFQEAYEVCVQQNVGTSREIEILNGIVGVLFMQENYPKAIKIAEKAYAMAKEEKDSLMCVTLATGIAMIYNKRRQFKESEMYLCEASLYGKKYRESLPRVRTIAAEALFLQERYDELEKIVPLVLNDSSATSADKGILLTYMINVWNGKKEFSKSIDAEKEAMRLSSLNNMPYLLMSLSDAFEGVGDYHTALALKDSTILYSDSLSALYNRQQIENSNVKIEVMKYKIERDQEMAKMKQRNRVWTFIALICFLLLLVAIMIVYNQKQRSKHRHQMMKIRIESERREKELAEERMKETELLATYKQELMKKEVEKKNIEISANAMFVSSRNKLIEDLISNLSEIQETRDIPAVNNLAKRLNSLLRSDNDQDSFMVNFEAANPDFSKRLLAHHPNLLQSDLRFLAYIRMNMTMKEIAEMLNINPDSCKRRKIRISQKLGLDSSTDLYTYILSL